MSTCKEYSWMYDLNTQENLATFVSYNCVQCRAYWNPEFRAMLRPVCILDSYIPVNCGIKFGFQDPVFHLKLDDDYPSPKVYDVRPIFNQTFLDPTGDPNTNAHSVTGHDGNALRFDGLDDHIALTAKSHQPYLEANSDFTVALWVRAVAPNPATNTRAMSSSEGTNAGMFIGLVSNIYRVRFTTGSGGSSRTVYADSASNQDTDWHHFAITREGYTITLYMDGSAMTSDTNPLNARAAYTAGSLMHLASTPVPDKFGNVDLDGFRLYDRALGTAEISALAA